MIRQPYNLFETKNVSVPENPETENINPVVAVQDTIEFCNRFSILIVFGRA